MGVFFFLESLIWAFHTIINRKKNYSFATLFLLGHIVFENAQWKTFTSSKICAKSPIYEYITYIYAICQYIYSRNLAGRRIYHQSGSNCTSMRAVHTVHGLLPTRTGISWTCSCSHRVHVRLRVYHIPAGRLASSPPFPSPFHPTPTTVPRPALLTTFLRKLPWYPRSLYRYPLLQQLYYIRRQSASLWVARVAEWPTRFVLIGRRHEKWGVEVTRDSVDGSGWVHWFGWGRKFDLFLGGYRMVWREKRQIWK